MSSTAEGRKPAGRYAVERGLAPHEDQRWAESFVVQLRLIGIEGARIGEALSEVESHCGDGMQSAQDAFGSPVKYAQSLHLRADGDHLPRAVLQSLVPMIVQIPGMLMLSWSFENWLRGQRLEVTAGRLVIALGFILEVLILVRFTDSVLRGCLPPCRQRDTRLLRLPGHHGDLRGRARASGLSDLAWISWMGLAAGAATLVGGRGLGDRAPGHHGLGRRSDHLTLRDCGHNPRRPRARFHQKVVRALHARHREVHGNDPGGDDAPARHDLGSSPDQRWDMSAG